MYPRRLEPMTCSVLARVQVEGRLPIGRWIKRRHRAVWVRSLARSRAHCPSRSSFQCNSPPINPLALYIKSCRERSVHFLPLRLLLRLLVTVMPRRAIHARDTGRASSYPSRRFLPRRLLLSSSLFVASVFLLHGTRGSAKLLVQHQTNGDPSRLCPPPRSLAILQAKNQSK